MKFKSEKIVDAEPVQLEKEEKQEEKCPIVQSLDIAFSQLNLINSLLSSIRTTLENIETLYEKHDSR